MSERTIIGRIIQKHDTEENWLKATNFIPRAGELIIYDKDASYSYERMKIGDGASNVNNLPFIDDSVQNELDALQALAEANKKAAEANLEAINLKASQEDLDDAIERIEVVETWQSNMIEASSEDINGLFS